MNKNVRWFLIAIFLVALVLRVYGLGQNPPSLNWDEVSQGYNAYSILKTGHDDWGQFLPITNFRAYGDYPTTLYLYLVIPFIATLGLNEFAIRLPSALCGALLSVVIYYLGKRIFKREDVSLFAAAITAISPWSFLLSRQVIQTTPAVLILSVGVWLFIKGMQQNLKWAIVGSAVLALSAYAYHNTRILAPIILLSLLFLYRSILFKKRKVLLTILVLTFLFFIPLGFSLLGGQAGARAVWVGILDQGAINRINEARGASSLPPFASKLVNNKVTYFTLSATVNYVRYFDPFFLAFKGGTQYQFSVQDFGVLNVAEMPLFYIGLGYLIWKIKKLSTELRVVLIWLILGPLPGAITRDAYQIVRTNIMLPPVLLTVGFGASKVFDFFKNQLRMHRMYTASFLFLLSLTSFSMYLLNFAYDYPEKYSQAWQYGYKQAIEYAQQNYGNYDQIIFTKKYGEPHEFVLFYTKYDPAKYQNAPNLVRYFKSDWYWVDSFDKYRFVNDWEIKEKTFGLHNALLITSPGNYPINSTKLETIQFLDDSEAFDIVKLD